MWRSLLLIAHAVCEWVEISQHHYRTPVRTHDITEAYANQTVSHKWTDHRNINSRLEVFSDRNKHVPDIAYENIRKTDAVKKEFIGTVERVSNVGLIRRVHLANTPVKPPSIENASAVNKLYSNFEVSLENLDESEELHRRVFYNKRKQVYTTDATVNTDDKRITVKNISLIKHHEEPNHSKTLNTRITEDDNFRFNGKIGKVTHDELETKPIKTASDTSTHEKPNKINHEVHIFAATEKTLPTSEDFFSEENNQQNKIKSGPDTRKFDNDDSINDFEEIKTKYKGHTIEETPTLNTKANTMEVLIKVMKTVADTISKHSHRSLNSKLRYLHELKNTILDNIENQIDSIWPDDTVSQNSAKRRARSAHDAARGHMEFPSSESTLMTISFLTFAVFLIKLVLQVIQTYKSKAMVAPFVVATAGRAAVQRLQPNIKENN